jgi:hypothetical protein
VADFSDNIVKCVFILFFAKAIFIPRKKIQKKRNILDLDQVTNICAWYACSNFLEMKKKISGYYTLVDISGLWDCQHGRKQVQSCKRQFRASYQDSKILFDKIY